MLLVMEYWQKRKDVMYGTGADQNLCDRAQAGEDVRIRFIRCAVSCTEGEIQGASYERKLPGSDLWDGTWS